MIHKFISNDNKGNVNTVEIGSTYTKLGMVAAPVEDTDAANKAYVDSVAGGSSGGGVLVVHQDENGVLDKTWQEINDAGLSVLFFNEGSFAFVAYCTSLNAEPPSWSVVYASTEPDGTIFTVTFIANSADGYPAYSE